MSLLSLTPSLLRQGLSKNTFLDNQIQSVVCALLLLTRMALSVFTFFITVVLPLEALF